MLLPNDFTAHTSPDHLGALLKWLRDRHGLTQGHIVAQLPATINQQRYSSFELNKRYPQFDELAAIYQALRDAGVRLTLRDRDLFLQLAKEHFASKRTHKASQGADEWEEKHRELAAIDTLPDVSSPSEQVRSSRSIPLFRMEISHLIGREEWLSSLYAVIAERQVKWIGLQGPPGVGKTSELHRIASYFQQYIPRHYVVLCKLPPREQEAISADVALELLLSEIVEGIGLANAPMPVKSIQARMKYMLDCLACADRPVLVLIDNAEHVIDEQGHLALIWRQFYKQFVHARHQSSLVLGTQEWPTQFTSEEQWAMHTMVPALTRDEGVCLLQRLGLDGLAGEQLVQVVQAVGGIPACLEWVVKLVKEPILQRNWAAFEDEEETATSPEQAEAGCVTHLLADASLFGGPVATRITPLLDRVIRRLSTEALSTLQDLALAPVPLAAPALKVLYRDPAPLQELRDASLLAAYRKRVQLLPMVAALIRTRLSAQQKYEVEERLVKALTHWLTRSRTLSSREMGVIIATIAEIYLEHHRLLDAAQFIIRHGWLSFHIGYTVHIARLAVTSIETVRQEAGAQLDLQEHCGALFLYYFLAPFIEHTIDASERVKDYHGIRQAVIDGKITLQPLTEVYLVRNLVAYTISQPSEKHFEEAHTLFSTCRERMTPYVPSDPDLQAALHEVEVLLLTRRSDFAEEQGEKQHATAYRVQAIHLYQEACDLLAGYEQLPALAASLWKKRLAKVSTSLGYHLDQIGRYEEALPILEQSILLKESGFVEPGSLASSYGEKSQALAALGRFEEALHYDILAVEEVERLARAGDTLSQEDRWIYLVNRAYLYMQLQRVDEAEQLLRQAQSHIALTRRNFSVLAEQTLKEIEAWREHAPSSHYQRDWRWIGRLREAISYNAFWWLAHAGPFSCDEQQVWQLLVMQPASEATQKQRETIISQSRQRELAEAIAEQRDPQLWYPAIPIEEVRSRLEDLHQLNADIQRSEPNGIIRDLYHGKIEEEICFLCLIEEAYAKDRERLWEMNQQLHPAPTQEEMQYVLTRVKRLIGLGLQREQSQEAAEQVISHLRTQLHLSFDQEQCETSQDELEPLAPSSRQPQQFISAGAAQRFFEAVLHEGGCEEWQVTLDAASSGARIEAASHLFILPDRKMTLDECKVLLEHEVLNHIADSVAGERSPLGLLAVGTRNYLPVLEGLALYHEMQAAKESGKAFDDSRIWLGALSTGLAAGVCTPAQSFFNLYTFLKAFLVLYRLLRRPDEDRETVQRSAHSLAQTLCLRTFRGVPDLQKPGVCYSKDACYLRGMLLIQREIEKDETIIDRLIGRTALEHLPAIERLGVKPALQPLRKLAKGADLDAYIRSFEVGNEGLRQ